MKILEISAKQMIGRNDVNVMIFVAIINGMIPIVHAFLDDDGHSSSVMEFISQIATGPNLAHAAPF